MKKVALGLLIASSLSLAACNAPSSAGSGSAHQPAEVEGLVVDYLNAMGSYDFPKMRSMYSPEFEIYEDGQLYDVEGFEKLGKETAKNYPDLKFEFKANGFDTDIFGDNAYTHYLITNPQMPDRRWFGSAFLKWHDGKWTVDHMVMMPEETPEWAKEPAAGEQPAAAAQPNASTPAQ